MKYISKYLNKMAKPDYFDSACVMLEMPDTIKKLVNRIANNISKDKINFDHGGIEDQAHVTVIYGVKDSLNLKKYFDSPIRLFSDNKITYFDKDDYSVAKIDIFSDELEKLHYQIKNNEENQHEYDYHPHITIAYLQPGIKLEGFSFPFYTWQQNECILNRNGLIQKVKAK